MSIYQPESFFETTLASALTASATTISVTTAPTITSGFMVIEASTSNREIIKYTGVSGTTLTGCVRGLATYGSNTSSGTGKAHAAGVDIANRNVHYYFSQYYDFLVGTSATGANTMLIGDDGATSGSNRLWKVDLSAHQPFWGLSSNGRMVVSEDGTTAYVISAGGSGIANGDGFVILTGTGNVDRLSTGGLAISAAKLAVGVSSGIFRVSNAIGVDTTSAMTWSGAQTWAASSTFSASASFRASATFESGVTFNGGVSGLSFMAPQNSDLSLWIPRDPGRDARTECITGNNVMEVYPIDIPHTITISKITFETTGAAAGHYNGIAIYSYDGNTRHCYLTEQISSAANIFTFSTIQGTTTLSAGAYLLGWTSTTVRFNGVAATSSQMNFINSPATKFGYAANASVAGVPPATVGAITAPATSSAGLVVPLVRLT